MQEARVETSKKKNKLEIFLDYSIFPLVKKLELNDFGTVILEGIIGRERIPEEDEEDGIEKYIEIHKVNISKDKRIR